MPKITNFAIVTDQDLGRVDPEEFLRQGLIAPCRL